MINRICAFTILLSLTFPVLGQNKVVDISDLNYSGKIRLFPDVEGKVVVGKSLSQYISESKRDDITVFPGWPVTMAGTNESGGVYCHLDDDDQLEIIYPVGNRLYAFNTDGTAVDGWPQQLDYPTDGTAAYGDIDGDGEGEIVVTTHQIASFAVGSVYAFEKDGTNVPGFPVSTEGGGIRTPALGDLNLDRALEIIITVRNWPEGFVYVFKGDGTVYPNWPQRMDYVPASSAAVGDIDGDDIPEIVTESYYRLHAYKTDGTLMPGFPYLPGENRVFSYSTPVLADIDGDGNREIICGDHSVSDGTGAVHIVRSNGMSLPDWPRLTASWIYAPPSVADINGDGLFDVVIGDQSLSTSPANKIYAWTAMTADTLPGFPVTGVFGINCQIILADIDGDQQIELIADDNSSDGKYAGFNHDGSVISGWPLEVDGSTFYINPFVTDINNDGIAAISGGGYNQDESIINLYLWNTGMAFKTESSPLPTLQYNTRRNGVYGDTLMVGIPVIENFKAENWSLAPNPASDHVFLYNSASNLNRKKQKEICISLYNSSGTLVLSHNYLSDNQIELKLSGISPGIYYIKISGYSQEPEVQKLVIIRK